MGQKHITIYKIGDEGAKYLAQALQHNNSVTTIDLGVNQIGDELLKDIMEYCQESLPLLGVSEL
ncbi:hypothetical protein [Candidatus Tisiphia endosymbiont of Ditula angustiorana]|uniref:hypothetical protein n=1 Tax=Candidatus Tisiphia endosymbiont of Ditula angustiorana TaxID=3066272 RepID=UPI00312CB11A